MKLYTYTALFALFATTSIAGATTLQSLSLTQKTARSDRIILGSVEKIHYEKHPTLKRIYTLTTVRVIDSLRGDAKKDMRIMIRQIGGSIGDWTQYVSGNASFKHGEEVLVFLRHNPELDLHFVVGMHQGKLSVDIDGNQIKHRQEAHQAHSAALKQPSMRPNRKSTPSKEHSLSVFLQLVRDLSTAHPIVQE